MSVTGHLVYYADNTCCEKRCDLLPYLPQVSNKNNHGAPLRFWRDITSSFEAKESIYLFMVRR
jgi:hypothetical protein